MNQFSRDFKALQQEFYKRLNGVGAHVRNNSQKLGEMIDAVDNISVALEALTVERSTGGAGSDPLGFCGDIRPGIRRIEDIPGRRVPYTLLVDIPIGGNTTSTRQQSALITQEGPFVATKRMATFQSAHQFETIDPDTNERLQFVGRSNGRYRPVHSAWDIMDSQHNAIADSTRWLLAAFANPGIAVGTALPSASIGLPSNLSSFRTMEFDGRITVINQGSSVPRQSISVPSSLWTTEINSPFNLSALDFFERGETITFLVNPLHVNNPPAGNVNGACVNPFRTLPALPTPGYPFLDGQYDAHEGICTPGALELGATDPLAMTLLENDSVNRLPDGILTLGFEGYRIYQPVGPAG